MNYGDVIVYLDHGGGGEEEEEEQEEKEEKGVNEKCPDNIFIKGRYKNYRTRGETCLGKYCTMATNTGSNYFNLSIFLVKTICVVKY